MSSSLQRRSRAIQKDALRRLVRRRSVILGYHGVAAVPRREDLFLLQLHPDRFREGLELMLEAGFSFLTVADLAERAGGGTPPPGLAAVSFDDALRNNLTVAQPILQRLGIPATVYAPTGWLGGTSPWLGREGDPAIMTVAELQELSRSGWEIGGHTATHADLSALDFDGCLAEIDGGCRAIEEYVGARPRTMAYPFGRYGPEAIAAARAAGLDAAVTTGSGSWDRFELTRAMMGAADPFPITWLKMTDRYEPLLASRPLRAVRSASKRLRGRFRAA